jgi:cation:H+ antiporter
MWLNALWLLLGLALIVKGGDLFVSSSVRIAELLRMPRVVIGTTLVSLATTTPEITVSIVSGLEGESGLAVGNAVGSCVCNFGLILGLMGVMREVAVHPRVLRLPLLAMLICGLLVFLASMNLRIDRWEGVGLLVLGVAFFVHDFRRHYRVTQPQQWVEATQIESQWVHGQPWLASPWGTATQFGAGAILVVSGSKLLVDSAVKVASGLGVPAMIIGLTIVALGTSLPELVTTVTSLRRNVSDLAVGNLLGANVANLTLIIGSAATIQPVGMSRGVQLLNFPGLVVGIVMAFGFLYSGRRLRRWEGMWLLGFYGVYLTVVTVCTAMGITAGG